MKEPDTAGKDEHSKVVDDVPVRIDLGTSKVC